MVVDKVGDGTIGIATTTNDNVLTPGSDLACLDEGYTTVTPVRPVTEATDVALPI
jgi:hypothetical protein